MVGDFWVRDQHFKSEMKSLSCMFLISCLQQVNLKVLTLLEVEFTRWLTYSVIYVESCSIRHVLDY